VPLLSTPLLVKVIITTANSWRGSHTCCYEKLVKRDRIHWKTKVSPHTAQNASWVEAVNK